VITVDRIRDWELVKRIVTHPRIYPHIKDDFAPPAEKWEPIQHEHVYHLLCRHGDLVLGLFVLIPQNAVCWEVHTNMLPVAYGEKAVECGKQGIRWVFDNTNCKRIVTQVPDCNPLALRFAKKFMTIYGYNPHSFQKDGKLEGVTLLGVSKE
jgi:hypothetical protein